MNNKTIYLDENTIKCLMEALETGVPASKARAECGLNNHSTSNQNNNHKGENNVRNR
jgi:hypothetical protein